jgi:hypothetical protein
MTYPASENLDIIRLVEQSQSAGGPDVGKARYTARDIQPLI